MDALCDLITPADCAVVFADQQAGLAFGVQSIDRQEANGGGYGIGLAYSRDMIHPPAPAASS